jgi:ABC-type branched-subunit amino acid transport system substrate-binding protein
MKIFGLPMVSYSATSPKLNDPEYGNFFRTIPDDNSAAIGILAYLQEMDIR